MHVTEFYLSFMQGPPPNPTKLKFENTDSVDIMISNALRDFPFGQNQPLKSADD
jgi:hypothetical protein